MKWGSQGMPKDLDQLNNLRVIFTVRCHMMLLIINHNQEFKVNNASYVIIFLAFILYRMVGLFSVTATITDKS